MLNQQYFTHDMFILMRGNGHAEQNRVRELIRMTSSTLNLKPNPSAIKK